MLNWWPFFAANSYRLSVPTIYVQNSVSLTNSFSRIIFINSLSPIFFYKFNITNSFSRINLRIRKFSKKFVQIRTTSFWFVFAKSVLCCERPVLYENEFLDNIIRSGHRRLARSFYLCYRYIDDLIVFNNKKLLDYLKEIYPSQVTVEKADKSDHLADYLDLTFIIDSGGKLSTRLYDRRDDFVFHIVNFPFLSSNIPSGPSYGVYISQLIRYAQCCSHYDDFRYCHKCLVDRLLSQGLRSRLGNFMADIRISLRNTRGQVT